MSTLKLCAAGGVEKGVSIYDLTNMGIPASTSTLTTARDCELRPRTEGGPCSVECKDCLLAIEPSVRKNRIRG